MPEYTIVFAHRYEEDKNDLNHGGYLTTLITNDNEIGTEKKIDDHDNTKPKKKKERNMTKMLQKNDLEEAILK